eukprot:6155249-Amphidinium_carterae.1
MRSFDLGDHEDEDQYLGHTPHVDVESVTCTNRDGSAKTMLELLARSQQPLCVLGSEVTYT